MKETTANHNADCLYFKQQRRLPLFKQFNKQKIEFYQFSEKPISTAGLSFGNIAHFSAAKLKEGDFVFVPGVDNEYVNSISFKAERAFFNWLKECSEKGITVCSICTGAFALGHAGLLKDTECTTHWRRVDALQFQFPRAKVVADIL